MAEVSLSQARNAAYSSRALYLAAIGPASMIGRWPRASQAALSATIQGLQWMRALCGNDTALNTALRAQDKS